MDTIQLLNGAFMPLLGLGTWQTGDGRPVEDAVRWALDAGYRHIDTASIYGNETGVGNAIKASGIPRDEIFVTTKVWNEDLRRGTVEEAMHKSLERLQLDAVDLYLIHWPVEDQILPAWKVMQELHHQGLARAIGVSNFLQEHLEELLPEIEVVPAVNQVEHHPHLQQRELRTFCQQRDIVFEAWAPLMQGAFTDIALFAAFAEKYDKTAGQILLRWYLEHKVVVIPKSVRLERIEENAGIFDFELDPEDISSIDDLECATRLGPDPLTFDF